MKFFTTAVAAGSAIALLSATPALASFENGLPWAADNRWAKSIPAGAISWYHHWEMGHVNQMPVGAEYVPTLWGHSKMKSWSKRKQEIAKYKSQHILAFNEPDIASQANMTPDEAVDLFMQELQPYANQGIKVSSPQMVYDLNWLEQFMNKCGARGCKISFMALHWYGSANDMDKFQTWVTSVNQKFKLPVWVTEYGITAASHPSQEQVNTFLADSMRWMAEQSFVERAAWNGCYDIATPPDAYATPLNAFFNNGGSFRPVANIWIPALAAAGLAGDGHTYPESNHKHGHKKGQHGHKHSNKATDSTAQMVKRARAVKADGKTIKPINQKAARKPMYSLGPAKQPLVRIAFPASE